MKQSYKKKISILKFIYSVDHSAIPIAILASFFQAAYPYFNLFLSAALLDVILEKKWEHAIFIIGILLFCNAFGGVLLDGVRQIISYTTQRVNNLTMLKVHEKILNLDYETLEDNGTLEKVNSTITALQYNGGYGVYLNAMIEALEPIFSIIASFSMVVFLCLSAPTQPSQGFFLVYPIPSFLTMIVVFFITILLNRAMERYTQKKEITFFERRLKAERTLNYFTTQVMFDDSKRKTIQLYDMNDMLQKEFEEGNNFTAKTYKRAGGYSTLNIGVKAFIGGIVLLYSYLFVGIKAITACISIGGVIKYAGAINQLNFSLRALSQAMESMRVKERYLDYFDEFIKIENKRDTGTIPVEKRKDNEYEIEFHHVSFAYPGTEQFILKDVSCKIDSKKKYAIVGKNGAGKTTFIKLLCRLYDPTEGMITLNGIDIKKYNYLEYLNLFGVVFQDFNLFAFPLWENVAASQNPEEERILECLRLAGIMERVEQMPEKIKTPLYSYDKNGIQISGGEAQKLAIARALYKDAPFVILDEPTAALDPRSEYEIYERFYKLVQNKTSIFISHRMSSCRFCDNILVFEDGQIREKGNHESLIDKGGTYTTLFLAQASYYQQAKEPLPR